MIAATTIEAHMGYELIENYGVIGDLHTVALIGMDGSIDFMCASRFDSPSVFAAVLDDERGGHFRLAPLLEDARQKQLYLPDTCVLPTRCLSETPAGGCRGARPAGRALRCRVRGGSHGRASSLTHLALISAAYDLDRRLSAAGHAA